MSQPLRIDFVSDIACPWCVIGLLSLEQAIERLDARSHIQLHFQPFELNPQMGAAGEDADEHLLRKYGMPREQLERNRAAIRERGAELGFTFGKRTRVCNTFDAHRLLHWAGMLGGDAQRSLKHALLTAYHAEDQDVSAREVLLAVVAACELDVAIAARVLESGEFTGAVREREQYYLQRGIQGVPAVILAEQGLISGGQPVEVYERALRQFAAEPAARA